MILFLNLLNVFQIVIYKLYLPGSSVKWYSVISALRYNAFIILSSYNATFSARILGEGVRRNGAAEGGTKPSQT